MMEQKGLDTVHMCFPGQTIVIFYQTVQNIPKWHRQLEMNCQSIYDLIKKQGLGYFQLQAQAGIFPVSPLSRE